MFHVVLCRETDDGYMTMQCQLYIDVNVLQYEWSIPYKYFVYSSSTTEGNSAYSSSTTEGNSAYEFLHGVTELGGKVANRCLLVPRCSFRREGIVTHFISVEYNFFMGGIIHSNEVKFLVKCLTDINSLYIYIHY